VPLGRPIRHRLLSVAVLGLVTAGLAGDALYRAISVSQSQRMERGREAVRDEIDRLGFAGAAGLPATISPIVGMRGGVLAGPGDVEHLRAAVPALWRPRWGSAAASSWRARRR